MSNPTTAESTEVSSRQLEALFRSDYVRLVRLASLLTRSQSTSEEVVQDAFIRLHRRWDNVDDPAAYVTQVVVNEARARLRRQAIERRHSPDPPEPVLPPEVDETFQLLSELSPRRQVALVLRYYEDMAIEDMAEVMDCRPATVKSLIQRGLTSLRRKLDAHTN
ncbi:MAG: sigma-70 family RNA polymerase sigma factor [Acidimicrobiia bacterium]